MRSKPTIVTAADPATPETGDGWYCVIGPSVSQAHPIRRSWKTTQEEAALHAEQLISNSFDGSKSRVKKLLVVKVVEVIEVEGPPLVRRTGTAIRLMDVVREEYE